MSGWIKWKLSPVVGNVQLCAFSRASNPPVAFQSPNPRSNVYRSVLKTTPLTLKTAVIGSSLCQEEQEKAQTHHFSFFHAFKPTCPLPGKSSKLLKNALFQFLKEEMKNRHMSWLLLSVRLQSDFQEQTPFPPCGSPLSPLALCHNLKSTFLFHNLVLLPAVIIKSCKQQ